MSIKKIGIIGLGLIGGSIARAVRAKNKDIEIFAVSLDEKELQRALSDKNIDCYSLEKDGNLKTCDLVLICTPTERAKEDIDGVFKITGDKVLISDVGSVKGNILKRLPAGIRFAGGHPMAGTQNSGYGNAKAHLFEQSYYVLVFPESCTDADKQTMYEFVAIIGGIALEIDKTAHDDAAAKISHLPHVLAYLLSEYALCDDNTKMLAAGGFKDITRIASSDPDLWRGIILGNKNNVIRAVEEFSALLNEFKNNVLLDDKDYIERLFKSAKLKRDGLSNIRSGEDEFILECDVVDRAGSIAKITGALSKSKINILNVGITNSREGARGALNIKLSSAQDYERAKTILKKKGFNIY
jgi:prephenate dehydrogenase